MRVPGWHNRLTPEELRAGQEADAERQRRSTTMGDKAAYRSLEPELKSAFLKLAQVQQTYYREQKRLRREHPAQPEGTEVPPPPGNTKPRQTTTATKTFRRSARVERWVRYKADGLCEACGLPAPFEKSDGTPFLEIHHVCPLEDGGSDSHTNAIAACPNCHARAHYSHDREAFTDSIYARVPRLIREYPQPKEAAA